MSVKIERILFITFIVFCISSCFKISAQNNLSDSSNWGKLYVTTWADDRQSAFSFSFDDGFISQYSNVREILNSYQFTATYFILPPFLTDPPTWRYGTWQMFLQMAGEGSELGSHSLNHPYLTQLPVGDTLTPNTIHYELYHSKKMIELKYQDKKCISFAYPYADHNSMVDSLTSLYYESARIVGGIANPPSINGMDWFALNSYQVEFDFPRDTLTDDLDELYEFLNWIDNSISNGTWGIQLAHEIVPFDELADLIAQGAYHPVSNEWFILLCDWLESKSSNKEIWIETIGNVTKYVKERDCHSYQVLSKSNSKIEIELNDVLNNEIYNYPLSAFISVPETWEFVLIEQGTFTQKVESFFADSMQLVLAKVIPDGGVIKLTRFDPNYVRDEEDLNPGELVLYQNFPNPFNPETQIKFTIHSAKMTWRVVFATLKVYDVLGKEVATLVNEEIPAGEYSVIFDARDLPSGLYIYTLAAGGNYLTRKMILLK